MAIEEHAVEGSLSDARRAGDDDGAGVRRSCFVGRGRRASQPVSFGFFGGALGECSRVAIVLSGRITEGREMSGRNVDMAGRRRGI